ncbi:MAG: galactose oxidase-like domain-containing protein [Nitriliruptorales bacterium]
MSAIDDKYAELGGASGFLGSPVGNEFTTPNGLGRARHYQGGSIYWTPATGAHEVHGAIRDKWSSLGLESGFLGFPLIDETATDDGVGRFNHFQGGSIYWTPATGAHEVHGAIRDKWSLLGWEESILGFPLTDETSTPDGVGRFNHFQGGSIYWTPATGAHEVHGDIHTRWSQLGWEQGRLGYPISDELDTPHGFGKVGHFQGGAVFWDQVRGAYEVWPAPAPRVCNAQLEGRWEIPAHTSGVVGVHGALLHTNKVLFFTYEEPAEPHGPPGPVSEGDSALLDLATGTVVKPSPATGNINLFCAGQAFLADGRLLVGGAEREQQVGRDALHTFTPGGPNGGSWQRLGVTMQDGRWYPTCMTLPDGRVLIVGGRDWQPPDPPANTDLPNPTYEVYDPTAGALSAPKESKLLKEGAPAHDTYPFLFVLPSGKVLMHAGTQTRFLSLPGLAEQGPVLEAVPRPGRNARTYGVQGTSVLLPLHPDASPAYRARVMLIGGGGAPPVSQPVDIRTPATETCEILDTSAASLAWSSAAPMAHPRVMPDAVLLPDGKVFVCNGSSTGYADNGANPVYDAEIYDPEANLWTTVCTMQVPRLYHAIALLLPDGRVLTAGTDSQWNPDPFHFSELRLECYSPPYLFHGPRPIIDSVPQEIDYDSNVSIQCSGPPVAAACLIRCGSVTHSFNSDQRYVGLELTTSGGNVALRTPPDALVAPPGFYLLFVLSGGGVPSVARFVRLS